ncbi:RidA family protein [Microvirga brassicacearum]|uniref:RidA family protein n=1 Tax=Microvirga brassicacearum TaxID=2580413 RepID=A0A5N3P593_9HYPH|nr:Rid family hydrolase [Microvirga brassicacearum]KAB0264910.1 RidA family protein [Microvirga brassicacearum]
MSVAINSPVIAPPFSNYSHGVLVPRDTELLFLSGQLGADAEGVVPGGCAAQVELCFSNIRAVLAEVGMTLDHIVRINAFVTAREHLAPYMSVRNALFAAPGPASTLMIVSGFARPEFVVEIEAIAGRPR